MDRRRTRDDWSDSFCLHDAPDAERYTGDRGHDGLEGKQVAAIQKKSD